MPGSRLYSSGQPHDFGVGTYDKPQTQSRAYLANVPIGDGPVRNRNWLQQLRDDKARWRESVDYMLRRNDAFNEGGRILFRQALKLAQDAYTFPMGDGETSAMEDPRMKLERLNRVHSAPEFCNRAFVTLRPGTALPEEATASELVERDVRARNMRRALEDEARRRRCTDLRRQRHPKHGKMAEIAARRRRKDLSPEPSGPAWWLAAQPPPHLDRSLQHSQSRVFPGDLRAASPAEASASSPARVTQAAAHMERMAREAEQRALERARAAEEQRRQEEEMRREMQAFIAAHPELRGVLTPSTLSDSGLGIDLGEAAGPPSPPPEALAAALESVEEAPGPAEPEEEAGAGSGPTPPPPPPRAASPVEAGPDAALAPWESPGGGEDSMPGAASPAGAASGSASGSGSGSSPVPRPLRSALRKGHSSFTMRPDTADSDKVWQAVADAAAGPELEASAGPGPSSALPPRPPRVHRRPRPGRGRAGRPEPSPSPEAGEAGAAAAAAARGAASDGTASEAPSASATPASRPTTPDPVALLQQKPARSAMKKPKVYATPPETPPPEERARTPPPEPAAPPPPPEPAPEFYSRAPPSGVIFDGDEHVKNWIMPAPRKLIVSRPARQGPPARSDFVLAQARAAMDALMFHEPSPIVGATRRPF
eukprot:tig00020610_g12069.t1